MAMRRTPSLAGTGRISYPRAWTLPFLLLLVLSLFAQACQKDDDELLRPGTVASNVVSAYYITKSEFTGNEIKMDGDAKDREWGGPLDLDRPYTQIRLTAADGVGDPGEPIYVSMKAVYTDTDIYMLFRWVDTGPNAMKDALQYIGPDLATRVGQQDTLLAESSWTRDSAVHPREDEDRLTLAFEIEPTGDARGSYRDQGCLTACHANQSPVFGRPGYGRLDVWQWLACRTNEVRNKYTLTDNGNFPLFGIPGYFDDFSADPVGGLVPDPGRSCWLPNSAPGSNRPRWVYRPENDPFARPSDPASCFSDFGEDCRVNNGLPLYYVWRNDVERTPLELAPTDTINNAVVPPREARKWRKYDRVSAYYYTYPTASRADVRGKAAFDDKTGIWSLEAARPLRTSDLFNDVQFTAEPGWEVVFTMAIADNSADRHWGSGPQVLRFGSRTRVSAAALGNGEER